MTKSFQASFSPKCKTVHKRAFRFFAENDPSLEIFLNHFQKDYFGLRVSMTEIGQGGVNEIVCDLYWNSAAEVDGGEGERMLMKTLNPDALD